MKSIITFFCLVLLTSCTQGQSVSSSGTTDIDPTSESIVETSNAYSTIQPEITASIPVSTSRPNMESSATKPYEFSIYYQTDFDLLDRDVPAENCPWNMSTDECFEVFGTKPAIPEGIAVDLVNEDDNYRYYQINNTLTGNSVEIAITDGMYDSYLSDVLYSLDDENQLWVGFYFYYADEIRQNHPNAYDIEQRYYQSAGPMHSHTRYHLVEGETYTMEGEVIASTDSFSLGRFQNFPYVELMDDVDYSLKGIDYLKSCDLINLVQ